ncbi:MAG: hypothetical protein NW206_00885 [Hyphomonadaceae bacterium]|nr:hypothetical protein [Hyphomonadaceae bacterium]
MSHTTTAPTPSADAASFWDKLAFYLRHAFSLFGHPSELARRLTLTRAIHKQFCDYIRPLEAMARGLIFIAALELAPVTSPPAPERKYRARLALPANAGALFDMDKPETWRAPFKLSAPASMLAVPAGESRAAAPRPAHAANQQHLSSAPCALRLEALLRAYEHRDAYAAALARQFARDPVRAFHHTAPPNPKLAHKTGYNTLFDLLPFIAEAYQRFLHQKLDALLPNTS